MESNFRQEEATSGNVVNQNLSEVLAFELRIENILGRDFPGGTVVKNPPANSGDTGSSPGPGRSHMPRSN